MDDVSGSGALFAQIGEMLDAAASGGFEAMAEHRATIVMMYVQAMVEERFDERDIEWLNTLLEAVQANDPAECRRILESGNDPDTVFAATGLASVVAGFFHHDECMTMVQGLGLRALLRRGPAGRLSF